MPPERTNPEISSVAPADISKFGRRVIVTVLSIPAQLPRHKLEFASKTPSHPRSPTVKLELEVCEKENVGGVRADKTPTALSMIVAGK